MGDWEYSDYSCPKCGENLATRDCDDCGGDGINDDLYDGDPLWYDEGDWEYCSTCKGQGAFFWCRNKTCNVTEKEIDDMINTERAGESGGEEKQ